MQDFLCHSTDYRLPYLFIVSTQKQNTKMQQKTTQKLQVVWTRKHGKTRKRYPVKLLPDARPIAVMANN